MSETKRGGPGRGQGRKPVKQGEETVTLSLRVTVAQREKLARLGGAEWVRQKIDRTKESNGWRKHGKTDRASEITAKDRNSQ